MHEIYQFLKSVGIDVAWLIAGLSGGLVSLRKDEKLTLFQKILTVLSGGVISAYMTPVVMLLLGNIFASNVKIEYGIAFVIGYSGLKTMEMVFSRFNKDINLKHYKNENNTEY